MDIYRITSSKQVIYKAFPRGASVKDWIINTQDMSEEPWEFERITIVI